MTKHPQAFESEVIRNLLIMGHIYREARDIASGGRRAHNDWRDYDIARAQALANTRFREVSDGK